MGGGTSSTTNSNQSTMSQVQLPAWVNTAAEQNYGFGQNVAMQPLQQYQSNMVSDAGPQMQQAWNLAANAGQAGTPYYIGSAAAALNQLGGSGPQQVNAQTVKPQTLAGTSLQPYYNPFTQSVINNTLPLMQQQLDLAKMGIGDQATQAGAFGGSRQGVQEGVANAQGALNMGQMAAGLNSQNFQQAQAAATGDISRNLQSQQLNQAANLAAQQSNQTAGLNNAGLNLQAGGQLSSLGSAANQSVAQQYAMLTSAGLLEQQQAQNYINANISKFNQANQYPNSQLGTLLQSLGMTPYGQTQLGYSQGSSQTQAQTDPNYLTAGIGALQSLGSMFAAPAGGTSAVAGITGLLGGSDRRLKTDITRIDTHPTGVPIYSYRYKGDPKTYPKVTGPMAEDVAKIAPHAVRPMGVGGRLGVHMPTLDAFSPPPVGPIPGALSPVGPRGLVGALGRNLHPPRVPSTRPHLRGLMPRGALSFNGA